MRLIVALLLIGLCIASMGCLQSPPASPSPSPTANVQAVIEEPARPVPLSVRLGDTIEVEYTMSVGTIVVETTDRKVAEKAGLPDLASKNFTPLRFIVGYNDVIPSIEKTVQGMQVNENKVVQVPPEKAFGAPKPELVQWVPRESFGNASLEVGFLVFGPDGNPVGKVVGLNQTHAQVDVNHPLAGKTLTLNITVLLIEPPRRA